MTTRAMTLAELQTVLDWAADEGWNPGLDDAQAMHAADPHGFFVKVVDGAPVAAVSVVNHTPDFAFLGLYLCRPEFRGQGHGMDVWRAGIAHAGGRSIGLDGVPEQQANYAKSGFVKYGRTVRFEGRIDAAPDPRVGLAPEGDIGALIAFDARMCGMDRTAFAASWFNSSANRQTVVLKDRGAITGCATFRRCRAGVKIGPLYAASQRDAQALLASNPFAQADDPVLVDVPDPESPLGTGLKAQGFQPVFETARMFTGERPDADPTPFHAIATMELG